MNNKVRIYRDAYDIQDAVNPRAIVRLLVEAIDDACTRNNSTDGARGDSAVYLLMDKLADLGLYPQHLGGEYSTHSNNCKNVE